MAECRDGNFRREVEGGLGRLGLKFWWCAGWANQVAQMTGYVPCAHNHLGHVCPGVPQRGGSSGRARDASSEIPVPPHSRRQQHIISKWYVHRLRDDSLNEQKLMRTTHRRPLLELRSKRRSGRRARSRTRPSTPSCSTRPPPTSSTRMSSLTVSSLSLLSSTE